jgi:hypothetical protein
MDDTTTKAYKSMPGPDEVIEACREHWKIHKARYEERCWTCALHFTAMEQKRAEGADDKTDLYTGELFDRLKILNGHALDGDWLVERLLEVAPDRLSESSRQAAADLGKAAEALKDTAPPE